MRRRDISSGLFAAAAGAALLGRRAEAQTCSPPCYAQVPAEVAAGVTVVNSEYPPGNILRYGTNTTPGTTPMTAAIQAALDVAAHGGPNVVYAPAGTYLTGKINWPGNNISLIGAGSGYAYSTAATPKTVFKAMSSTTIVFDLVQTGDALDRTGNHLADFRVDGALIALVGINCSAANIIERVNVVGCVTAGLWLSNFTNSTRVVRCGLVSNFGWGLQVDGASTTTFSVEDSIISLNQAGGVDIQAGVLARFSKVVSESNSGPGLRIYRPSSHTNAFIGLEFDSCWFEDNAINSPNYTLTIGASVSDTAHAPARILFRNCRFNPSVATRKHMSITCAKWVTFENCQFDASTVSDTIALSTEARYVAFIESATATGFPGLSPTQLDNAIAQGGPCYSSDRDIQRVVGSGAPAAPFQNGWTHYNDGFATAKYWFDREGYVCIEGAVKSGTINTAVFTLPVGYRPKFWQAFAVDAGGTHGLVYVTTDGDVRINVGSSAITHLQGIRFRTSV